jgi:hypothetical protein
MTYQLHDYVALTEVKRLFVTNWKKLVYKFDDQ